ncbi:MAG: M16 family metallopeptidase [Pyrinomonadaceae bacterium]
MISLKYFRNIFPVAFGIMAMSFATFAQTQTPPKGSAPKPFNFPKQDVFTLKNGLKVTMVEYGSVPKISVSLSIGSGAVNDPQGKRGVAGLTAQMLKEGTKDNTSDEIADKFAGMGGSVDSSSGLDGTSVSGDALSEFAPELVQLLADVALNPNFQNDSLMRLKANRIRSIAVSKGEASTQANEKFRAMFFGSGPFAQVNPTEDQIKGITLEDIAKFYKQNYVANRAHLYIVGKFDKTAVKKAVDEAFSAWKRGAATKRTIPVSNGKYSLSVIDRAGAPQSTIIMGVPAPSPSDPDFIKFNVMNQLLGGSFGSRITSNIRENKGYTYSPYSMVWTRFKTGYWAESADVTTEATGASIKEILFEIDRLKNAPPTAAEMQGIKNFMIGIYTLQNSSRNGVLYKLADTDYNELGAKSIDEYVSKVDAVTAKDVQDMAKKYLSQNKMTIVVVGDRSKIDEQLKLYEK